MKYRFTRNTGKIWEIVEWLLWTAYSNLAAMVKVAVCNPGLKTGRRRHRERDAVGVERLVSPSPSD